MKLNKSISRIIRASKGQFIGMLAMVILSGYLFVMFALLATNLTANRNAFVAQNVQGDLEFYTADKLTDLSDLQQRFQLKIQETLVVEKNYDDKTLRLFTANTTVNIPAVLDGSLPGPGQVALDRQFITANKIAIGDSLTLDGRDYKVSGVVCLPNYTYVLQKEGDLANDPLKFGIGIINSRDITDGSYLYSVKFEETQNNIYNQAKPLKAAINAQDVGILAWNYAKYDMKTVILDVEVLAITVYSLVLPPLLMLLSAVLVAIVLARMVKNQKGVIGTLYALGYRKKEIMNHYLRYPLLLGTLGGILGSIMGIIGFNAVLDLMLSFFPMPILKISLNPFFIVLCVLLSVGILMLGTYFALNKILKNSPVSLMKQQEDERKLNFLERKIKLDKMSFRHKFSLRQQLRSFSRLIFLVLGVLSATMLLMIGLILKSSLDHLINQDTNNTLDYQYEYVLNRPQTALPAQGEPLVGMKFVPDFDLNNRFEIVGALPTTQMVTLVDLKGQPLKLSDDTMIVSKSMAKKYKLKVGDIIDFTDITNDKENRLVITDIADTNVGDVIFTSIDRVDAILSWPTGSYNAVIANRQLTFSEGMIYMTKTPESLASALAQYMTLMNVVLYGIALVAAVIALIIMNILATISIDESKGDISTMKAFGYQKKEIGYLLLDGVRLIVILTFIIAVPLAFSTIGSFMTYVFDLIKLSIETRLDWYYIIIGFILIYFAFELSKQAGRKKIDKVPLSEALKSQRE